MDDHLRGGEAPGKAVTSAAEVGAESKGHESTGGRRKRGRGVGWRFFLALLTAGGGEAGSVWSEERLSDDVLGRHLRGPGCGAWRVFAGVGLRGPGR